MEMVKDTLWDNMCSIEERVIQRVLRKYLDRTPTMSDIKMCNRSYTNGIYNKYVLSYNDIILGRIEFEIDGLEFHVMFKPN